MTPAGAPAGRAVPGVPEVNTHREKEKSEAKTHLKTHQPLCIFFPGRVGKRALVSLQGCRAAGCLEIWKFPPASQASAAPPPPRLWLGPLPQRGRGLRGRTAHVPPVGSPDPAVVHLPTGWEVPSPNLCFQNPANIHTPLSSCSSFRVLSGPVWEEGHVLSPHPQMKKQRPRGRGCGCSGGFCVGADHLAQGRGPTRASTTMCWISGWWETALQPGVQTSDWGLGELPHPFEPQFYQIQSGRNDACL